MNRKSMSQFFSDRSQIKSASCFHVGLNDGQNLEILGERMRFHGVHDTLGKWSAVDTITIQPKPSSDITKIVFAKPTWKAPAK